MEAGVETSYNWLYRGKQTLEQFFVKYGVNERTIRRSLKGMRYVWKISRDKHVVIQMDTTYTGGAVSDWWPSRMPWERKSYGKYVAHETLASYKEGVKWLKENGFRIYGVVVDGLRGQAQALWPLPVQLCQFHQILTVRHYLTQKPDLDASRE